MTLNLRKKSAGVCSKRERVIRNWYVERRRRALEGGETDKANTAYETWREERGGYTVRLE